MAVIHHTTLKPTKLELLTSWLPSRPWYRGGAGEPQLAKAGGFRLDDPEGEVGMEFVVVADTGGAGPAAYLVPLTYRGAPLDGADHALVGTMEHGVLGRRWVYDGCHDPVLVAQLLALVEGRAQAQDQDVSDVPARDVTRSFTGDGPAPAPADFTAADRREDTELSAARHGVTLRLCRLLEPGADSTAPLPAGTTGHVGGCWDLPDGTRARGLFATLHTTAGA
ncbi:1,4-alpha-glucan branching protein [Streptomyces sp. VNUA116]|uniref:maltokinase N-terminal cap-like domain-containing protein n=1 Tax=Streptomyces sp. VNUA116 TaxID=3062449 RepID=UPI002675B979|nr:1,4-alpha-glucan branching protein [Streptomyces sp. VNUA116]WKU43300.1 1,4-alpha-glucan branching protein [Streptomyces sp. VNUA116]